MLAAMQTAEALSGVILAWLGQSLAWGTAIAACTWLPLRVLGRRVPPGVEMWLWAIVLVKFVVPVGPAAPFSLAAMIDSLSRLAPGVFALDQLDLEGIAATGPPPGTIETGQRAVGSGGGGRWGLIVAATYGSLVLGLLALRIASYRRLRRKCLRLPPSDDAVRDLVHRTCARLGVWTVPDVRVGASRRGPFVLGFVRPILVLSPSQLTRPSELQTVVVHEVVHLRRGDMFVRYLQWIAGTLLFFWPVVGWVNRRLDLAREYACDEWALSHGRLSPSQYARCLLDVAQAGSVQGLAYHPACMAGRPVDIERRIDVILENTRRVRARRAGVRGAALVVIWSGLVLSGVAPAQDAQWANTKEDVKRHAEQLHQRVRAYAVADVDANGEVTIEESRAFVTAVAWNRRAKLLERYPKADLDGDGELSAYETYAVIRGESLMPPEELKVKQAYEQAADAGDKETMKKIEEEHLAKRMEHWHRVLDLQADLLDKMETAPDGALVAKLAKSQAKFDQKLKQQHAPPPQKQPSDEERAKKIQVLKDKIAELDAAGHHDKADELRKKLQSLQE